MQRRPLRSYAVAESRFVEKLSCVRSTCVMVEYANGSRHLGLDERMQLRVQHVGVLALGDLVELGEVAGPVVPGEYPPAIARLAASLL
mmetsp:Transcript_13953/g.36664  ORF Transcript_13953/g.36664 Transcript_13953/m.36664 type:complete len:88 (+) Transcript_13953:711-974(+)